MTTDMVRESAHDTPETLRRRQFLNWLSLGLIAVISTIIGIPIVGFLFAPLLRKPAPQWQTIGPVDRFTTGRTVRVDVDDPSPLPWTGIVSRTAIYLRRTGETNFLAFAVNCTHLGCPVRWLPDANLFMCPCHGGVFNQDGTVAGGPPPRPLPTFPVRITNGMVEVLAGASPLTGS